MKNSDYRNAAHKALEETFGFAPAIRNIQLMEGADNGAIVEYVAFYVLPSGKGYSWRYGEDVERNALFDAKWVGSAE